MRMEHQATWIEHHAEMAGLRPVFLVNLYNNMYQGIEYANE